MQGNGTPAKESRQEDALRGVFFCLIHLSVNVSLAAHLLPNSVQHVDASARLINKVQPWMVFLLTLFLTEGSPLHAAAARGAFEENTAGDNLREEERLIRALDLKDTILLGMHTSNSVPIAGKLPHAKECILGDLRRGIAALGEDFLAMRPRRGAEGRYVVIESTEMRARVKETSPLSFFATAPVIILACYDMEAVQKLPERSAELKTAGIFDGVAVDGAQADEHNTQKYARPRGGKSSWAGVFGCSGRGRGFSPFGKF